MERSGLVGIVATPPGTKNKQKLGSRTGSYGQKYSSVFIYIYIYIYIKEDGVGWEKKYYLIDSNIIYTESIYKVCRTHHFTRKKMNFFILLYGPKYISIISY